VENVTEINKRSSIREDILIRNNDRNGNRGKGGRDPEDNYEDIDVFSDEKKKKQLISALSGNDEYKQKLNKVAPSAPKIEL
jgi:hypothetical protein